MNEALSSSGEPNGPSVVPPPSTVITPDDVAAATADHAGEVDSPDSQNQKSPDGDVTPQAPQPTMPAGEPAPVAQEVTSTGDGIAWTASEFIAHQKSAVWYLMLAGGAIVVAAVAWLLTRDIFPSAVVVLGALIFGFYAGHKPRELSYAINNRGLTVGKRLLPFSDFRSFSVVPDGAFSSIELVPLKRFATLTVIYFDPADEDNIVELLGAHLPMESASSDAIDQFMRRIRF